MSEYITTLAQMMANARSNVPAEAQSPRSPVLPFEFGTKKEGYGKIGEAFGKGASDVVLKRVEAEEDWRKKRQMLTKDPETVIKTFNLTHGLYLNAPDDVRKSLLNNPGFQQQMENVSKHFPGVVYKDETGRWLPPETQLSVEDLFNRYVQGHENYEGIMQKKLETTQKKEGAEADLTANQAETEKTKPALNRAQTGKIKADTSYTEQATREFTDLESQSWYNAHTNRMKAEASRVTAEASKTAAEKGVGEGTKEKNQVLADVYNKASTAISKSYTANFTGVTRPLPEKGHRDYALTQIKETRSFLNALPIEDFYDTRARFLMSNSIQAVHRSISTSLEGKRVTDEKKAELRQLYLNLKALALQFVAKTEEGETITLLTKSDMSLLNYIDEITALEKPVAEPKPPTQTQTPVPEITGDTFM